VSQTIVFDRYQLTWNQIVPKSSAIVPGARNAEAIGLNQNHMDMIKFCSAEDDDFLVVGSLLQSMGSDLPEPQQEYGRNPSQSEGTVSILLSKLYILK
jgi:hypothetical protein